MSIWSTFYSLGLDAEKPYLDYTVPSTDQYVWETTPPEQLAELPRGGFVDLAGSWYELPMVRLSVEDDRCEAEVFLPVDQVQRLRDALDGWLEARERFLHERTGSSRPLA